jgi:site-specific DNA-methyltransferase (adenine-specific)
MSATLDLRRGDSWELLKTLPENSVDACPTDPPYELGFMAKAWDNTGIAYSHRFWAEVLRVLKPGAFLVSFGGTRTYHRMACAIEDAGFEIRDQLGWTFGSGFPKSMNCGDGRGTALKPAWEPICLARKPLIGTVAANLQAYGTGCLNIDACRIPLELDSDASQLRTMTKSKRDGEDG